MIEHTDSKQQHPNNSRLISRFNIKQARFNRKECGFSGSRIPLIVAQSRFSNRKTKDFNRGKASDVDPASDRRAKETVRLYVDRSGLLGRVVWSAEVIACPEEQGVLADHDLRKEVT